MSQTGDFDYLRNERIRMLFDTIADLNSTLDLEDVLIRVVDRSLELTGAERGIVVLPDEEGEATPRLARDHLCRTLPLPIEFSRVIANRVLTEGQPERHEWDLAESGEFPLTRSVTELGLRTLMCVPIRSRDSIIGALYVDSRKQPSQDFRTSDLRLLTALAGQAGVAIENARLRASELAKERLEERLRIAAGIQERLLPHPLLELPGFEAYGVSRPCEDTGGDYFDYIPLGEHRVALVVGDVSGHGLDSSLYMMSARACVRSSLAWERDPARIVRHLDRELSRDMKPGRFMTLLFLDLDLAARSFRYVSAGHEPPLILRTGTDRFERPDHHGPPLGLGFDAEHLASEPISITAGDLIVLDTDGIAEARGPAREGAPRKMFGEERVRQAILSLRGRAAREIVEGLMEEVSDFVRDGAIEDDLTLIVMKATGR